MRWLRHALLGSLLLLAAAAQAGEREVRDFAARLGLHDIDSFVETIAILRDTGWLPERYITKRQARDLGWQPGDDLCRAAPGHVIGGDRFGNREGRLPDRYRRRWSEADLDFACGRRGAKRLVFSSDGLIFVTVDHYETFEEVPE